MDVASFKKLGLKGIYHHAKYIILGRILNLFSLSQDDFNWNVYNEHYRGEMEVVSRDHTLILHPNDYIFDDGGKLLLFNKTIKKLHPNWRLLYETIHQLKPRTVLEIGCGNGMHLHNIKVLLPIIKVFGVDRSAGQLRYLQKMNPHLNDNVKQYDASLAFPDTFFPEKIDVCFTQAVIMHIKTEDNHLKALANIFNIAQKQVVLMENWESHDFMSDIKLLHEKKKISWNNLYFYYRYSDELQKPHLMICSSTLLDYPALSDYQLLSGNV